MNESILVIDDDIKIGSLIKTYLSGYGFEVTSHTHPDDALELLSQKNFDLVILDIMMPGKDGFEVCRLIRKKNQVPIIMLTARGEVTDRIVGIELGADDYLAKPFEPRELLVRIQAILRRAKLNVDSSALQFGNLVIDLEKVSATLDSSDLELSTAEFDVLKLFVTNPGKTFSRDQLISSLHGGEWASFDRSIDVIVSRLRHKLQDHPKKPRFIRTIWGTGYRFIGHTISDEGDLEE